LAASAARRRRRSEDGFTLVELLVILLIIGILIAILIPTFYGAVHRAQNRAAQTQVRNALTAEKTSYTDTAVYTATPVALAAIEPSLNYVATTPGAGTRDVYVAVNGPGDTVVLGAQASSGSCFWLQDVATGSGALWSTSTSCSVPMAGTFSLSAPPIA